MTLQGPRLREKGFKGEIMEGESLSRHCSLKVGGEADLMVVPGDLEDLGIITGLLEEGKERRMVLGGGTNVLFPNGGFRGCVIRLGGEFLEMRREEDTVLFAGGGALLPSMVAFSAQEGLEGLECLSGIPGTVGGGVRMNAGSSTGEISDTLESVNLFRDSTPRWVRKEEIVFSYRSCGLMEGDIILGARFRLKASSPETIRRKIQSRFLQRKGTQPLDRPSAGCWFKNPEGDSAGRLIDEAGMKGARCGGAQVSSLHANFLVNTGGATARDFQTLAEKVRQAVLERFGIRLEEEVRVIDG